MSKVMHPQMGRAQESYTHASEESEANQNYVVDDVSDLNDQLEQFNEANNTTQETAQQSTGSNNQQEARTANKPNTNLDMNKIDPRLESVIFAGKLSRDITIADNKYTISTLSNKEHNELMKELVNLGEASDLLTIRILTLAQCIKKINDIDFEDLLSPEESLYKQKVSIIDNMQLGVVERLWNEYENLVKEHNGLVKPDDIKK